MTDLGPLAAALAKAQTAFPAVTRDKTVTVQKKAGGSYSFKYAPLDSILNAVRAPLSDNGLVIVQLLDEGALVTSLLHESGAILSGRIDIPVGADIQALGSAITYLRRYAIQAMLGIAAEDDDDGNRAAGNTTEPAAGGEELEILGNLRKTGTIVKGSSDRYGCEFFQSPAGHVIGFRLKLDGDDRDIPQVLCEAEIGEALFLATGGDAASLVGQKVTVKGKLHNVKSPGRRGYYRLVVAEIETADWHIPAADAPPDDEPIEAPSAELFALDDAERALVAGGLPDA